METLFDTEKGGSVTVYNGSSRPWMGGRRQEVISKP